MKIRAELRLKHAVLWRLSQDAGGVKYLAELFGIGAQTLHSWIMLRKCPVPGRYNRFYTPDVENRIEQLTGMPIGEVFPPELKAATHVFRECKLYAIEQDIPADKLVSIAEMQTARLEHLSQTDVAARAEIAELQDSLKRVLKTLSYRERIIIELRYGLYDGHKHSLEEVGKMLNINKERVRQIEAKAIRKLQQPSRSDKLVGHL